MRIIEENLSVNTIESLVKIVSLWDSKQEKTRELCNSNQCGIVKTQISVKL